jgi:hypothetical protein
MVGIVELYAGQLREGNKWLKEGKKVR